MKSFLISLVLFVALNLNAQGWKCVEKECSNGKKSFSMADAVTQENRIPPPREIDVDGETYSLKVKDDIGPNDGERILMGTTSVGTKEIEIRVGQSLESEKDTVWHECIHAAFGSDTSDLLGKKWGEEQAAYKLTPRLLKILETNPKLIEYLTQ